MKEKPKVSWNEVIGLEDAKEQCAIYRLLQQREQTCSRLAGPRGIFYGPPMARHCCSRVAAEIDGYFINVDAASMMSKGYEAEKNISKLFKMARNLTESEGYRFSCL